MDELDMFPANLQTPIKVLVTVFDEGTLPYSIEITRQLRNAGINTEIYTGSSKLRGQIGLANDKKIPLVIVAGTDEIQAKTLNLKNMITGEQQTVQLSDLISEVMKTLEKE
jgi:histidyl-tRNA synthetase